MQKDGKMGIKKDESVLADEKEALADVENPATSTEEKHIKRDVAIKVNSLDIFGDTT